MRRKPVSPLRVPKIRIAEDGLHTEIDLYLDLEFDSANNAALTTLSISSSIDAEKCNSGKESADCIRPLFDTDEFTSFVLVDRNFN